MAWQDGDASGAISPLYWINGGAKEEIRATKSAGRYVERHYQVLTVNTPWLQYGVPQCAVSFAFQLILQNVNDKINASSNKLVLHI